MRDRVARQSLEGGLPGLREAVGQGSVDLLNSEQGFLLRPGFAYRPRPVMQSYVASTPLRAAANARFFASPSAPEFVVLRLYAIDDHFPMMDDGFALATLARRTPEVLVEQVAKWNHMVPDCGWMSPVGVPTCGLSRWRPMADGPAG